MNEVVNEAGVPEPRTEAEILALATACIERILAPSRAFQLELEKSLAPVRRVLDGVLQIENLAKERARFAIEVKRSFEVRDLPQMVRQIEETKNKIEESLEPMIVARYISKSAQEWLRTNRISYADATGNFMLTSPSTSTFLISDSGGKTDPWRGPGRPRNTLKGDSAAQVVRAILESRPPFSIPQVMSMAETSSGVTYRVVDYLERENLLFTEKIKTNGKTKRIVTNVDWRKILFAWSDDYSYQRDNSVQNYIEPRGIDEVLRKLKEVDPEEYVISGSVAANRLAPYADSKQLNLYARYPADLAKVLELRPVQTGANVQIASTKFAVVFARTTKSNGLNYASPSQIAVELLSGSGRNPDEGEVLMDWMDDNKVGWQK
jgi:hypothetical protein